MGLVVFAPTRSALPEHASVDTVTLEIDFSDAIRSRIIQKYPHRSSNGQMETLYEGADTQWAIDLAPVLGDQLARVREFLDSTADGQIFQIYLYGTESAPVSVMRSDSGYSLSAFQRTGAPQRDPFTASITVIEQ